MKGIQVIIRGQLGAKVKGCIGAKVRKRVSSEVCV